MWEIRNCFKVVLLGGLFSVVSGTSANAQLTQNQALDPNTAAGAMQQMAPIPVNQVITGPSNTPENQGYESPLWPSNPAVMQELQLTDFQLAQLKFSFAQDWSRYQTALASLDENLLDSQQYQGQLNLLEQFHRNLIQSTESVLINPGVRIRFLQLFLQYRWYNGFDDDIVQQTLNLSPEQDQMFLRLNAEWNQQMANWYQDYPYSPLYVRNQFQQSRNEFYYNVYSILNPQQFSAWRNMIGEPFDFEPEDYFQY